MCLFSIIIPTYNSETTLSLALNSLINQTYKDFEVVIIDGGSTDETLTLINSFKDKFKNINTVSEKDEGIYDAMNKGINIASGKWLYFMGSDDVFYNNSILESLANVINDTKAKVVYGNCKIIGDTGWAKDGDIYDGPFTLQKLLEKNICHQAMCYQAQFVKNEIGYYNQIYVKSADWDFNLRCWAKGNFEYVDIIIASFASGGVSTDSTDHVLISDFVDNLQAYFGWGLFHPNLNNSGTWFYPMVLKKQKERPTFRLKVLNFKNKLKKKIKSLFK
jgi:glycosyltransferase involved in cell wall biosynthesis